MLKLQVRDQLMMRNKIRQILWLLCCLPVLTGCIGEDHYANDPKGNFEQLWKIIEDVYKRQIKNNSNYSHRILKIYKQPYMIYNMKDNKKEGVDLGLRQFIKSLGYVCLLYTSSLTMYLEAIKYAGLEEQISTGNRTRIIPTNDAIKSVLSSVGVCLLYTSRCV